MAGLEANFNIQTPEIQADFELSPQTIEADFTLDSPQIQAVFEINPVTGIKTLYMNKL